MSAAARNSSADKRKSKTGVRKRERTGDGGLAAWIERPDSAAAANANDANDGRAGGGSGKKRRRVDRRLDTNCEHGKGGEPAANGRAGTAWAPCKDEVGAAAVHAAPKDRKEEKKKKKKDKGKRRKEERRASGPKSAGRGERGCAAEDSGDDGDGDNAAAAEAERRKGKGRGRVDDDPGRNAATHSSAKAGKAGKATRAHRGGGDDGRGAGQAAAGMPPHTHVLAPMVGGSELPFRMLCRRYGADLCYTPMIYSGRFVEDAAYRESAFRTCEGDRPLVAHFCGNDPGVLLRAARLVEARCDAVDLNLGCPQRVAHSGHFGSYLLGKEDRPLVTSIVRALSGGLRIPVFCKIRLLDATDDTEELCRDLVGAGCALIAVHARYRGTATRRRDGPAHLGELSEVVRRLRDAGVRCPVLANGNVRAPGDVGANAALTGADGVMSAEGLLDDPALFAKATAATAGGSGTSGGGSSASAVGGAAATASGTAAALPADSAGKKRRKIVKRLREAERLAGLGRALTTNEAAKVAKRPKLERRLAKLDRETGAASALAPEGNGGLADAARGGGGGNADDALALAGEYLDLCDVHAGAAPVATQVFHVRRMCKALLSRYQLLDTCYAAQSTADLRDVLARCHAFRDGAVPFVHDAKREAEAAAALERRKAEAGKRKAYEARMVRKAKREGLPLDHYVKIGLDPPTRDDIDTVKALAEPERVPWWRERFGQHCFAFHCAEGGCKRDRACAFLHTDISRANPTWLEEAEES